jgi:hypothetical protein
MCYGPEACHKEAVMRKSLGILFLLAMASSGCVSTLQERRESFHRFVQPNPETTRVVQDTLEDPDRCYAVSRGHTNRGFVIVQEVDCETHRDVVQDP